MDKGRDGERMKLGAFFHPTGNHVAAWLHPDAQIDAGTNFRHYAEITQTAERGKFDLMFVADAVATRDGKLEALSRWPQYMAYFDPLTLLPALAAVTTHIGLCATATTSYNEPYHIARKFASLDHISGGRAGWNVVTSSNVSEAFNFGRDPDVGLELLSNQLGGFDLSGYDLDGPLPDIPEQQFALSGLGNTRNIIRWAREERLTIRQIYQRFAAARGQRTLIGSPSEIVDDMEEWFRGYGVDGFLFHPSHLPGGLDDFVALVIPELQSRGLFRAEYEGMTLRENMELERPKSRYVSN